MGPEPNHGMKFKKKNPANNCNKVVINEIYLLTSVTRKEGRFIINLFMMNIMFDISKEY